MNREIKKNVQKLSLVDLSLLAYVQYHFVSFIPAKQKSVFATAVNLIAATLAFISQEIGTHNSYLHPAYTNSDRQPAVNREPRGVVALLDISKFN